MAPTSISPAQTPAPTPRTYIVQQGDTLNLIAQRFGGTVEAIQAANGLTGTEINVGESSSFPEGRVPALEGWLAVRQKVVASSPPIWRSTRPARALLAAAEVHP